jgi:hypothetical protein
MVALQASSTRQGNGVIGRVPPVDTRLVAAVQRSAGARVHEAAGLLNAYHLWAAVQARATWHRDGALAQEAEHQVSAAKVRLRQFLSGHCATCPAA